MADIIRPPLRLRPSEQRTILLAGDLVASVGAMFAALFTWYQFSLVREVARLVERGFSESRAERLAATIIELKIPVWFYLLPLVWLLLMVDSYETHTAASWRKTLRGIAVAPIVGLLGYSLLFTFNQDPESLPRIGVGAFLIFASILTLAWRAIYIRLYTSSGLMRRVLIVGAGKAGHSLADIYRKFSPPPFILIGYIDDDLRKQAKSYHGFAVLGSSQKLLEMIETHRISDIVVAINGEIKGETFQTILDAQEQGVEVTRMPIMYEEMTQRVPVEHLESDWVIRSFVDQVRVSGVYELFKRLMDIFGGLLGLLIFAIIFPFTAIAIVVESGFPIFYSQERLGKGGRLFRIYKFRSMMQDAEADGEARPATVNDPRVTRVGNFLRRTRLDEMPQFLSVLTGEMSLVGPRAERPELVAQFQKQIPFYRARLLVKPGLTGWAQINYGYVASVKETVVKLEYDLYYIKHRTLNMDFNIVLRTIGTVLRRTGR
ncbi:MAG: sugar transferase [Anaerolineales bacterium]|uniref:sugar transferase n=1 Tax=Candidatus Villigracilis affinis TaxID=3140682 RepID=UPI001B59F895|nr:sugar transferase [Anaerolineales bacterium]MBK9600906.1 sugar transferase [Anaerolineales bacterium]MBL0344385.1 sugar transferase [Anaerolineales bacterium]MBP8048149.1 sugar transferase [Anaerolineales bacterium]